MLVEQTGGDREKELIAVTGGRLRFTDGLLLSPVGLGQRDAHLLDVPYPLVLLGERIFGGPKDHVAMHNTSAAEAAVRHLLDKHRRRVAVVGANGTDLTDTSSASLRMRGYRRALAEAGIEFDPRLVCPTPGWNREAGAGATHALVASGVAFDAVFALNDTLGLGVLRALDEEGLAVPEDVAVIGFDNVEEGRFAVPSLSSVDTGRDEIASMAVQLLVEGIDATDRHWPPRTVKPDFSVVERESTSRRLGDC